MGSEPPRAARSVLLFDFGGTLDADGLPWEERFHAAFRRQGGRLSREEFAPLFRASDRALAALPGIRGFGFREMVEAEARLLGELLPGGSVQRPLQLAQDFLAAAVAIVQRNRPILAGLAREYRLGIVSNFTGNLEPCLEELGLKEIFAVRIDSTVVGLEKPDPYIFRLALDELGAESAQAWMIGDNPGADIRAAGGVGLRTAWLAPSERRWPFVEGGPDDALPNSDLVGEIPIPTLRIHRLTDLPQALAECTD